MSYRAYEPRVAIVTGAAQGIGRAIAIRLAEDGIDLALNDILAKKEQLVQVTQEIESKGRKCIIIPADVSKEDEVKSMVLEVAARLGSVDIVRSLAPFAFPFIKYPLISVYPCR